MFVLCRNHHRQNNINTPKNMSVTRRRSGALHFWMSHGGVSRWSGNETRKLMKTVKFHNVGYSRPIIKINIFNLLICTEQYVIIRSQRYDSPSHCLIINNSLFSCRLYTFNKATNNVLVKR